MTHRCIYVDSSETLARHRHDRVLGGVCAGIARWVGWPPWVIRLGFVLTAALGAFFPVAVVYVALWALLPVHPCTHARCRREGELDEILGDDWGEQGCAERRRRRHAASVGGSA